MRQFQHPGRLFGPALSSSLAAFQKTETVPSMKRHESPLTPTGTIYNGSTPTIQNLLVLAAVLACILCTQHSGLCVSFFIAWDAIAIVTVTSLASECKMQPLFPQSPQDQGRLVNGLLQRCWIEYDTNLTEYESRSCWIR
jgi:hypothetical protein